MIYYKKLDFLGLGKTYWSRELRLPGRTVRSLLIADIGAPNPFIKVTSNA